jgi:hypothetical protein
LETFGHTYILNHSEIRILNSFLGMKGALKEQTIEELLNPSLEELLTPKI